MNDNLFDSPWVQSPQIPSVQQLIKTVEPVNYPRGSGQARQRLDLLEQKYRTWVSDCIDLAYA